MTTGASISHSYPTSGPVVAGAHLAAGDGVALGCGGAHQLVVLLRHLQVLRGVARLQHARENTLNRSKTRANPCETTHPEASLA
eukprot:8912742-Pyramimonas_sp.AAC.1